jgi:hypothetical protein
VRILLAACSGLVGAILLWAVLGIALALIFSSGAHGARDPLGSKIGFILGGVIGGIAGLLGGSYLAWTLTSNPATASANAIKLWVGLLGIVATTVVAASVYNRMETAKDKELPPDSQLHFEVELPEAVIPEDGDLQGLFTISVGQIPARWDEERIVKSRGKLMIRGDVPLQRTHGRDPRELHVFGPASEMWKFTVVIAAEREKAMAWSDWTKPEVRSEVARAHAARMRYRVEFGPKVR